MLFSDGKITHNGHRRIGRKRKLNINSLLHSKAKNVKNTINTL